MSTTAAIETELIRHINTARRTQRITRSLASGQVRAAEVMLARAERDQANAEPPTIREADRCPEVPRAWDYEGTEEALRQQIEADAALTGCPAYLYHRNRPSQFSVWRQ